MPEATVQPPADGVGARGVKVMLHARSQDEARTISGLLTDIAVPAPDAVSLFEAGAVAWRVEAYFLTAPPDRESLAELLAAALGAGAPPLEIETVPDENWVAISQSALPPVRAGRFTIHGSHDRHRIPRGPFTLEIDAGEAFGTAHHATTLGCLHAIDELVRRRRFRRVLDLGSGSGVLALAAARALPATRVVATDVDPEAVRVARDNVRINGAAVRIQVLRADGLDHPALRRRSGFDLIIANILAGPLIAMARRIAAAARPGAAVVLSGLLVPQAAEVTAAYRAAGFHVAGHRRIAGWSTLTLTRAGRPIRPQSRLSVRLA